MSLKEIIIASQIKITVVAESGEKMQPAVYWMFPLMRITENLWQFYSWCHCRVSRWIGQTRRISQARGKCMVLVRNRVVSNSRRGFPPESAVDAMSWSLAALATASTNPTPASNNSAVMSAVKKQFSHLFLFVFTEIYFCFFCGLFSEPMVLKNLGSCWNFCKLRSTSKNKNILKVYLPLPHLFPSSPAFHSQLAVL